MYYIYLRRAPTMAWVYVLRAYLCVRAYVRVCVGLIGSFNDILITCGHSTRP